MLPVVDDLARPDSKTHLEVIGTEAMGRNVRLRRVDNRGTVYVIGAKSAHSALSQAVVRDHGEERGIHPEIGQGDCNVGLGSAVGGLKFCRGPDLVAVGRGKAEHHLSDCEKALHGIPSQSSTKSER